MTVPFRSLGTPALPPYTTFDPDDVPPWEIVDDYATPPQEPIEYVTAGTPVFEAPTAPRTQEKPTTSPPPQTPPFAADETYRPSMADQWHSLKEDVQQAALNGDAEFSRKFEIMRLCDVSGADRVAAAMQVLEKRAILELADDIERKREADKYPIPDLITLSDLLAEDDEDDHWRVKDLLPSGGNVVLSAQAKAGKTHLAINFVRSILDGKPFLGVYPVEKLTDGCVVVADFELNRKHIRKWYREQAISESDRLRIWPMRGKGSVFDIQDKHRRRDLAARLAYVGAKVFVLDCLSPVLGAADIDENDNSKVARWLECFSEFGVMAGLDEMMIIHHMGHSAERTRGASKLIDWPDASWSLLMDRDDKDNPDRDAPRRFKANGRDVQVPELPLHYDGRTGRLSAVDAVSEIRAGIPTLSPRELQALDTIAGARPAEPMTQARMISTMGAVGMTENVVRGLLRSLKEKKLIDQVAVKGAGKPFQLTPQGIEMRLLSKGQLM